MSEGCGQFEAGGGDAGDNGAVLQLPEAGHRGRGVPGMSSGNGGITSRLEVSNREPSRLRIKLLSSSTRVRGQKDTNLGCAQIVMMMGKKLS